MNWEALGAIGEIVGAIAVVVTLGYLAVQIRQNTKAVKASTHQSLIDSTLSYQALTLNNPEVARIRLAGSRSFSELTEEDQYRCRAAMEMMFRLFENAFVQHGRGTLDDEGWHRYAEAVRYHFAPSPGVVEWWRGRRIPFGPSFSAWVDKQLAAAQEDTGLNADSAGGK
jgi:hypothetical protein